MLPKKLCFVDIETTGTRANFDRIIEIAILRVENNKLVKTYHSLINPKAYIPLEIERLTGITKEDLEDAPSFYSLKDEILEMLSDTVFVAHNVRFDYGFLKNEFKRELVSFSSPHFCTVRLSRMLFPRFGHHDLDSLITRFNFKCRSRHRALDDAKVLWDFYKHINKNLDKQKVHQAILKAMKNPSLPLKLPHSTFANLPECPGVYIFYGKDGVPLYIGKSLNIYERVRSHFSSDYLESREMKIVQQVESIETIVTAGEFGALLRESELIKKMQPIYNRMLRRKRKLLVLKHHQNEKGYEEVDFQIWNEEEGRGEEWSDVLGVFKSLKQMKDYLMEIAKENKLCLKLLKVEKTNRGCFYYQLGYCQGACLGEEKPIFYNAKFMAAFSRSKIKSWPFSGSIVITEKSEEKNINEYFVVDKWCIVGSVKKDDFDSEDIQTKTRYFDYDAYKILVGFLSKKENLKKIKIISVSNSVVTR